MEKQSAKTLNFIQDCIVKFNQSPKYLSYFIPSVNSEYSACPSVLLWNPIASFSASLNCPLHSTEHLADTNLWTSGENAAYMPRLLFNYGRNALLVSKLYKCCACKRSFYRSHDPHLVSQLPVAIKTDFHIFHKVGFTHSAYTLIQNTIATGLSFSKVEELFRRSCLNTISLSATKTEYEQTVKDSVRWEAFQIPNRQTIKEVFMADFNSRKEIYDEMLSKIVPETIAFDHTFKIRYI